MGFSGWKQWSREKQRAVFWRELRRSMAEQGRGAPFLVEILELIIILCIITIERPTASILPIETTHPKYLNIYFTKYSHSITLYHGL